MIQYDSSQDDFLLISLRNKNELYHRKYVNKILYFYEINSQIHDSQRKNNNFFFTGGYDSIIKLWENNHSRNKLRLLNNLEFHTNFITDLEISKKNNILFSSSSDKLLCIWDLNKIIDIQNTVEEDNSIENTIYSDFNTNFDNYILCLKYNELNNILYSSDNQGIITSFDINKEYIINNQNNEINKKDFYKNNDYSINSIDISIQGNILIASLNKDIIIIDTLTQKRISTLKGHNDEIIKVKLSLDGQKILSQSLDNTIKLWDIGEQKMISNCDFINSLSSFYPYKNFNDIAVGFTNGELYKKNILNNESHLIEKKNEKEIKEIIINDEENQIIVSNENGHLTVYDFGLRARNININSNCIGEVDLNEYPPIGIGNSEKNIHKYNCEIVKNEIIDYSIMNNQIYAILKYNEKDKKSDIVNLLLLHFIKKNNCNYEDYEELKNILNKVDDDILEKWNDSNIDTGILNIIINEFNCFKNDISNLNFNFIENIIENEFYINSSSELYNIYDNTDLKKNTFGSFVLINLLIYFLNKEIFDHLEKDIEKIYKYKFIKLDNLFIHTYVQKKNYGFYLKDNNNPNIIFPNFCFELYNDFNIYLHNNIIFDNNNQNPINIKLFYFDLSEYLKGEYRFKGHNNFELKSYHTFYHLLKIIFLNILDIEKIQKKINEYFQYHSSYTDEQKRIILSQDNLYYFFYFGVNMDDRKDSDNIIFLNKKNIYNYEVSNIIKILNNQSIFNIYMHLKYEEAVSKMNI